MYPENHLLKTPLAEVWKNIGIYPHHGIVVPLFSLHSKDSLGIGEFFDLMPIIDWLSMIGMDTLQLLPINDTGDDASPYNQMSSCALNPLYIRLSELPKVHYHAPHLKALQQLNLTERVDYPAVKHHKMALLWQCYKEVFPEFRKEKAFQDFQEANSWLEEYGLYKALRKQGEVRKIPEDQLFHYLKEFDEEINFHAFLQYHAFEQMKLVKAYAEKRKVFLKADIPILVSPDSVDFWFYNEIFFSNYVAGSPPDFFNERGQKWNLPIFNWDAIKNTDYSWWKQRLRVVEDCFHIYRLDHIIGIFRIWGIPDGKESREGNFFPSNRFLWPFQGKEHLEKIITLSSLLPIGEDLGTVPPEVRPILHELGICGTKVVRWEKYWDEDSSFIPLEAYEPISLTTLSNHDIEVLAEWWEKFPEDAEELCTLMGWPYEKTLSFETRLKLLKASHKTPSLFHVNPLQEYLALIPELVRSPKEERINVPGTVGKNNWSYRFIPKVEEILSHPELFQRLREILSDNSANMR